MKDYTYVLAVGVSTYEQWPKANLRFPARDASQFAAWGKEALQIPDEQSVVLASGLSDRPDLAGVNKALGKSIRGIEEALDDALDSVERKSIRDASRLFMFFSGHGMAGANQEVLMLTAEAEPDSLVNLGAQTYIRHLRTNGWFQNVWLFADCCRSLAPGSLSAGAPFVVGQANPLSDAAATAVFSTIHGLKSFEETSPEELAAQHGHFTRALLEGLWGAAADPATGEVTWESLRDWLEPRVEVLSDNKQEVRPEGDQRSAHVEAVLTTVACVRAQAKHLRDPFREAMLFYLGYATRKDATVREAVDEARSIAFAALELHGDAVPLGENPFVHQDNFPRTELTVVFPDGTQGELVIEAPDGASSRHPLVDATVTVERIRGPVFLSFEDSEPRRVALDDEVVDVSW